MALGRCFRVYQKNLADSSFSLLLDNVKDENEFLLFESGIVASLDAKECTDFKQAYSKLLDCYGVLGALQFNDGERVFSFLALVTSCTSTGKMGDADIYKITSVQLLPMWYALPPGTQYTADESVLEIQKLLGNGNFYFAVSITGEPSSAADLTLSVQKRFQGSSYDYRFFWNRRLHTLLRRHGVDTDKWLLKCICGGVEIRTVYVGTVQAKACIISRLSCERMGTRFNVRGVNDLGHVANFVETEQIVICEDAVTSHVQTRGSVPLFWEQTGVQIGAHKIKLSRGFETSAPAFRRHLKLLEQCYGESVIVNLLGGKEGEKTLSDAFQTQHENSEYSSKISFVAFDYHALVRQTNKPQNLSMLWDKVRSSIDRFGFFQATGQRVTRWQSGQIRTNCLDCLDRTNCAQSFFALNVLTQQLQSLNLLEKPNVRNRFEDTFRQLWTQNGDHCSRIYAGTGALEGKSKIKDASRSVTRTIQNNLMDGSKQEAMDLLLLGTNLAAELYDRASALLPVDLMETCPTLLSSIVAKTADFTEKRPLKIFCGTWNVNGGQRLNSVVFRRDASLSDWLLDFYGHNLVKTSDPIDIYAIGLEEIVDLNASNIVSSSSTNQKMWTEELLRVLSSRDHRYVLLSSLQLVGVCLFVFVRPHLAPFIKDLACDSVKTGMGGATGNKGGVAIRFLVHSTSIAFVCSHFAAGQSQVQERNNDFQEIYRKVQFPRRTLPMHDFLFWMGDFNYRIDLPGEEVKDLVKQQDFDRLTSFDQLTTQKTAGNVFVGFEEGRLRFAPTYKYDQFSDDYDTSEKCRSPAWTDRVLWRRRPALNDHDHSRDPSCKLHWYNRVELKTSDHRPVGALFAVDVVKVRSEQRRSVFHQAMETCGPADATVLVNLLVPVAQFPAGLVEEVLSKVCQLGGQPLLVKFVQSCMWLIFGDGQLALATLSLDGLRIGDQILKVRLRTPDWEQKCEVDAFRCFEDQEDDVGSLVNPLLSGKAHIDNIAHQLNDLYVDPTSTSNSGSDWSLATLGKLCPVDNMAVQSIHHVCSVPNMPATSETSIAPPKRPPPPKAAPAAKKTSPPPEQPKLARVQSVDDPWGDYDSRKTSAQFEPNFVGAPSASFCEPCIEVAGPAPPQNFHFDPWAVPLPDLPSSALTPQQPPPPIIPPRRTTAKQQGSK